jgi:putative tryptophan/tyrosine transport system substrate-binding protein
LWRRTVVLIDKILKGAIPAGIPVEEPTKFDLNLKTAKALALLFRLRYWLSPTK